MLLTFARLQLKDAQGIKRCITQIEKLMERQENPPRLVRFKAMANTLLLLVNKQLAAVVDDVKMHAKELKSPEFDVEAAVDFFSHSSAKSAVLKWRWKWPMTGCQPWPCGFAPAAV